MEYIIDLPVLYQFKWIYMQNIKKTYCMNDNT